MGPGDEVVDMISPDYYRRSYALGPGHFSGRFGAQVEIAGNTSLRNVHSRACYPAHWIPPMPFIHEDFLLGSQTARRLFHRYAAAEPILDYHCHLPPQDVAQNR